ncbi:LEAF RUST 10 DISEASE-RESISTANCE LOCUS RECEPTOR-LIKE PROTEIN KINASE-like 1.5 [Linum grandiflorum]
MPPSPPPPPPIFHLLLLLFLFSAISTTHSCNSHHNPPPLCPPFTTASPPPYPFSTSPGCGHPSFPLKCSTPHSILSFPNSTAAFSVISFNPNSSTLSISPVLHSSPNCSSLPPPFHFPPPFTPSDGSCSRLSALRSCSSPPILPNCSICPHDCSLVKSPLRILPSCSSAPRHHPSLQGCQSDVLDYLDKFLVLGFDIEFDGDGDEYFSKCRTCKSSNGVCGFNSSDPDKAFLCFKSTARISPWIGDSDTNRVAILCSVFTALCLVLVVLVLVAVFRSRQLKSVVAEEDPTATFLRRHRSSSLLPPVFTYEELEASTNRFDPKRKIGDGGFGSVYLGQLFDGRIAAVKYLHRQHHRDAAAAISAKSFCNEILILSSIDHPNLVKLQGYCSDPRGMLLVHDYVPNGTLADHLHGPRRSGMTWRVRLEMAVQMASALEYLHFSVKPAIVHRDITSSNIFVERDMRIKVGDFGLSRLLVFSDNTTSSCSSGYVWTGPQGTPGYLDPDYHKSFRLTEKSDVYSFGVVLLELITGLKPVDQNRDKREMALADLAVSRIQMGMLHQVVDPVLKKEEGAMEGVDAVAELAFQCVAADKDDRPDAREAAEELKRIRSRTHCVMLRGSGKIEEAERG